MYPRLGSRFAGPHEYRPRVGELNKKFYGTSPKAWPNRPIEGEHPNVYLDGIVLKRNR